MRLRPLGPPQPAYRPTTGPGDAPGANERAWIGRFERFTQGCADGNGTTLAHYTPGRMARDVDAVRRALGAAQISILGQGVGAVLGQLYATAYPQHLRRLVVDGSFDPGLRGYPGLYQDAPGTEDGVRRYFAWVERHDDVYLLGATRAKVEKQYYREEARLTAHPLRRFGPSEWSDTFRNAAFDEPSWPDLMCAFSQWVVRGRTGPMLAHTHNPSTPAELAALAADNFANSCSEGWWPRSYDRWRRDAFAAAEKAPFIAWSQMLNALGCRTWPVQNPPAPVGSDDAPPMLLVAAEDDDAYFRGTLELRRRFPGAVLASVPGSVTAPLFTGNACIDRTAVRYLRDGTLPDRRPGDRPDATCSPAAKPKPSPADVAAAKALRAAGYARGGDGGDGGHGSDGGRGGGAG